MGTRLGSLRGATLHRGRARDGAAANLQVVEAEVARVPGVAARLAAVAAQVSPLRHPRVVATEGTAADEGVVAVVTEAVLAVPLGDLLVEGEPLPVPSAMAVVDGVLRAVGAAHAGGVVHCGICPERVLVEPSGEVRLDGFALARALALTGGDVGAPVAGYASPERLGGVLPDGVGDLYAAAGLAHRLLVGTAPAPGAAAPVHALPAVSQPLALALAADPRRRYPNAATLRGALTGAADEHLGAGWRERSDLGSRAIARLRELGALEPPRAPAPPPPPAPVVTAPLPPPPVARTAVGAVPVPAPAPARRARRGLAAALVALLVLVLAGAGVAAALLLTRGSTTSSSRSTPAATPRPLAVGADLALTVDKQTQPNCVTDYVVTAHGSLTGSGSLSYHWEQNDQRVTDDTTIPITNQSALGITEDFRYQGNRSGRVAVAFVLTAPQATRVTQTIDVACP